MKTITDDPEGFFDNGGWSFLEPESAVSNFYLLQMYVSNQVIMNIKNILNSFIIQKWCAFGWEKKSTQNTCMRHNVQC